VTPNRQVILVRRSVRTPLRSIIIKIIVSWDITSHSLVHGVTSLKTAHELNVSNVRHPRRDLYNSKELDMLTLTVEHNYICYHIIGVYNNDMFRPYMWTIIRLWMDLQLRLYYHACSGLGV